MTIATVQRVQSGKNVLQAALCMTAFIGGSALCAIGALRMEPDELGGVGIVTILVWQSWLGLALLVFGFFLALSDAIVRTILPWFFLLALVAALHLGPAYAYGPLRYSWAWKHIGIIDYLMRHGSLDRSAAFLSAYHNWPGFFWVSAWVAERFSAGPAEIARLAAFTPPILETLYLVVLHILYRNISLDRRLIFVAQFVFLSGNWVGQDYFSPQGTAYLFYLVSMALCFGPLHRPAPGPGRAGGWLSVGMPTWFARGLPPMAHQPSRLTAFLSMMVVLAIIAIITVSHQLTPLVLTFSLAGLALIRRLDFGFAAFAFLFNATWILYFAAPFVSAIISSQLAAFGDALLNLSGNFSDLSSLSPDQVLVSIASRSLTGLIILLGITGVVRRIRSGHVDGPILVMLAAPLPLVITTSYGGEMVFRVYLFMLPSLAFLAAATVFPNETAGRSLLRPLVAATMGCLLVAGFLLSNNGKDMQYRFRQTEVDAAFWLYSYAPKKTLLIEGARNYPSQFLNYENFTYLPITNEPAETRRQILVDPAGTFSRWLNEPDWAAAFVILTRSQKAYVESQGIMPPGSFDRLIDSLSASPKFKIVYRNEDAIIFAPNRWAPPE